MSFQSSLCVIPLNHHGQRNRLLMEPMHPVLVHNHCWENYHACGIRNTQSTIFLKENLVSDHANSGRVYSTQLYRFRLVFTIFIGVVTFALRRRSNILIHFCQYS